MFSIVQYPTDLVTFMGFEYLCMYFVIMGFTYLLTTYFDVYVKVLMMVKYFSQRCSMEKFVSSFLFSNPFVYKGEVDLEDGVDSLEHPKHHLQDSNLLNLPDNLLSLILGKLSFKDKIFFGAVCHSFQSIFKEEDTKQPCRQLPLLMVPPEDNTATHCFCNIFDDNTLFGKVPLDHRTFCRGSHHGWLVTVKEDLTISLSNPFLSKDNKIQLPPITTFEAAPFNIDNMWHYNTVVKATISADPMANPEDCVVMAIYGIWQRLAFCKPGDKIWNTLTSQVTNLVDIIYCRDKFHVLGQEGEVFVCDLNRDADPKLVRVAPALEAHRGFKRYLVEAESTGDLLQITRTLDYESRPGVTVERSSTTGFNVFKLDPDTGNWIEVHDLQGSLVFVGDNTSLSVRIDAADTHGYGRCKPNTIWFTDDNYEQQEVVREHGYGPFDVGVFDFEDGTVKPTYPVNIEFVAPPSIWIQPILC